MENGIMENNQCNIVGSNHFWSEWYDILQQITKNTGHNVKILYSYKPWMYVAWMNMFEVTAM